MTDERKDAEPDMADSTTTHYRLAAIWFADIVDYSYLAARDEPEALTRLRAFQRAAREIAAEHEGRVVKLLGDGILAEFPNTVAAVQAALELQPRFRTFAGTAEVTLRIGVHVGDVASTSDGDLYGDGVNVAARMQQQAAPGQILGSAEVWTQIRRHPVFRSEDLGSRLLKGVGHVHLRALHHRDAIGVGSVVRSWNSGARRNVALLGVGAILVFAVAVIAAWVQARGNSPKQEAADTVMATDAQDTTAVVDSMVTNESALGPTPSQVASHAPPPERTTRTRRGSAARADSPPAAAGIETPLIPVVVEPEVGSTFRITPYTIKPACIRACDEDDLQRYIPVNLKGVRFVCSITVGIRIDTEGNVTATDILTSSGFSGCDQAAEAWARSTKWTPAYNNGQAVVVWIAQPLTMTTEGR
jgi:TonB family protein